ncbi:uncharacterized protein LOC124355937 [Homalodisca vitripennis]|uniref:uncharacterized protein LOC124355937 n=1 Tax=Homalodisca vitripennis TaxID=197043 RepID=UPI001EEC6839|nr:uncharacterized protein LOC124355937 [Homalodisca vitripennis]
MYELCGSCVNGNDHSESVHQKDDLGSVLLAPPVYLHRPARECLSVSAHTRARATLHCPPTRWHVKWRDAEAIRVGFTWWWVAWLLVAVQSCLAVAKMTTLSVSRQYHMFTTESFAVAGGM